MSPCEYQKVGPNANGFDNYVVLNPLPKSHTSVKTMKTSRGLIKLGSRAGSVWEDDKEKPSYVKLVCPKSHISGSLKGIQKEYNI